MTCLTERGERIGVLDKLWFHFLHQFEVKLLRERFAFTLFGVSLRLRPRRRNSFDARFGFFEFFDQKAELLMIDPLPLLVLALLLLVLEIVPDCHHVDIDKSVSGGCCLPLRVLSLLARVEGGLTRCLR